MKTILPLILFLSYGFQQIKSQDSAVSVDYIVGKPYKVFDASEKLYYTYDNELLSVKIRGNLVNIQKFNHKSMSFIKETIVTDLPKNSRFEKVIQFKDRLLFFYSLWDPGANKEQLLYREIDFKTGSFLGKSKLVVAAEGEVSGTISLGFIGYGASEKFNIQTSADSSKMLIMYVKKPLRIVDEWNYDILGIHVFDKSMTPIWNKELEMPYTEKKMDQLDFIIDNLGDVFILSRVFKDNTIDLKKSKMGSANYHLELFRIAASTNNITKTELDVGDKHIISVRLIESESKVICVGFYGKGKQVTEAEGVFLYRLHKDGAIEDIKYLNFPLELVNMYVSKRKQERNEKEDFYNEGAGISNLRLRDILLKTDGSIIIVGEQYYTVAVGSPGGSSTTAIGHYNDILISKINANGTSAWMNKLPKRQIGKDSIEGLSFFYDYNATSNSHYFFIMDNLRNKELDVNSVPENIKSGNEGYLTACAVHDETGKVSKHYLFDLDDVNGMPVFQFGIKRIVKTDDDQYLVEVYKRNKEDVLIKLFRK